MAWRSRTVEGEKTSTHLWKRLSSNNLWNLISNEFRSSTGMLCLKMIRPAVPVNTLPFTELYHANPRLRVNVNSCDVAQQDDDSKPLSHCYAYSTQRRQSGRSPQNDSQETLLWVRVLWDLMMAAGSLRLETSTVINCERFLSPLSCTLTVFTKPRCIIART